MRAVVIDGEPRSCLVRRHHLQCPNLIHPPRTQPLHAPCALASRSRRAAVRRSFIHAPSLKHEMHTTAVPGFLTRAGNLCALLGAIRGTARVILRLLFPQLYSTIHRRPKSAPRTSLVLTKEVLPFLKPLEVRSAPQYAGMSADEAPDSVRYHRRTANGFESVGRRIMLPLVWGDCRRLAPRH